MMRKADNEHAFEAAMEAWAKTGFGDDAAIGRIISRAEQLPDTAPQPVPAAVRRSWRKLIPGVGIAAAVAVAMLTMPGTDPKTGVMKEVSVIEVEEGGTDNADTVDSFALLYTPTMEEELYL